MTYKTLTTEALNKVLSTTSPYSFKHNISKMHDIYRLPINTAPTLAPSLLGDTPVGRLTKFKKTLLDEVAEVDDILTKLTTYPVNDEDILADIADWLSDIVVYCRSEAMKFGIPLEDTLDAVMGSNFTKLPADGIPVYDENGKFLKDMTQFVPPEPAIKTILFGVSRPRHPYENVERDEKDSNE